MSYKNKIIGYVNSGAKKTKFIRIAIIKTLAENERWMTRPELKEKSESNLRLLLSKAGLDYIGKNIKSSTFYKLLDDEKEGMTSKKWKLIKKRPPKMGKKDRNLDLYKLNFEPDSLEPVSYPEYSKDGECLNELSSMGHLDKELGVSGVLKTTRNEKNNNRFFETLFQMCSINAITEDVVGDINEMSKVGVFGIVDKHAPIKLFHKEGYVERSFSAQRLLAFRLIVEGVKILSDQQKEWQPIDEEPSPFILCIKAEPDIDICEYYKYAFDYFSYNGNFENRFEPVSSSIQELKNNFTPDFNFVWVNLITNGVSSKNWKDHINVLKSASDLNSKEGNEILNKFIEDIKELKYESSKCIIEICHNNLFYKREYESVIKENFDKWMKVQEYYWKRAMRKKNFDDTPDEQIELFDRNFWNKMVTLLNTIIPLVRTNRIEEISIFSDPKEIYNTPEYFSITYNSGIVSDLKMCFFKLNTLYNFEENII